MGFNSGFKGLNYLTHIMYIRHVVAQLVQALHYKLEGRGSDSRWCH